MCDIKRWSPTIDEQGAFFSPRITAPRTTEEQYSTFKHVESAKAHRWKLVPDEVFAAACEQLNQIIAICD